MTDADALKILMALGNSSRFEIFRKLQQAGELSTTELNTGKAASTMSHHMKMLVDAGVVKAAKFGKTVRYRVRGDTLSGLGRWARVQGDLAALEDLTRSLKDQPI